MNHIKQTILGDELTVRCAKCGEQKVIKNQFEAAILEQEKAYIKAMRGMKLL